MPRNYKRKTEAKYSLENLKKAIEDVRSKRLTFGKAAKAYSVPKTTIFDHMKKPITTQPKCGRKTLFTEVQELEMAEHILQCSKLFYGLTIGMVRKLAYRFAETNKLQHSFDKNTEMAGKDWYHGFMKRHPHISLRKPEATSLNRINAFNDTEVKMFFENLETIQNTHHFEADRIYNVDETGITNVHRNSKILAPKGQKQVGKATSAERGTTTTVVCAMSAAGHYIPPFFIFKRKRMNEQLLRGGNSNMVATVSDSGWITERLFVDWLHHFISFARPTKERPLLLILDNHESHVSLDCYLLCRNHGIILLSLPPHTSHRLQPLDLTFFGPLKCAYNRECELYMTDHPGRTITQYDVVELFTKAFNRCSNLDKAANGFRAAGICPLRPEKFEEELSKVAPLDNSLTELTNNISVDTQALLDQPDPTLNLSIPLSDIVNLPILLEKKTKRNTQKKHSTILTSSPLQKAMEERKLKRDGKNTAEEQVKKEIKKQRLNIAVRNRKHLKDKPKNHSKGEIPKKKKEVNNTKDVVENEENEYYCAYCHEKYVNPPHRGLDYVLQVSEVGT